MRAVFCTLLLLLTLISGRVFAGGPSPECMSILNTVCTNMGPEYGFVSSTSSTTVDVGYSYTTYYMAVGVFCARTAEGYDHTPFLGHACHWGYSFFNDDRPPLPRIPPPPGGPPACGSIINPDELSVGEVIPLVGISEKLTYFSNRVPGYKYNYKLDFPVQDLEGKINSGANLRVTIAGNVDYEAYTDYDLSLDPVYNAYWDGKDSNGNYTPGSVIAEFAYLDSWPIPITGLDQSNLKIPIPIGSWNTITLGLGGWSFSSLHYYDIAKKVFYNGGGGSSVVEAGDYYFDTLGKIRSPNPSNNEEFNVYLVSSEAGDEAYLFDRNTGLHLFTLSAVTGKKLKTFTYNGSGQITSIEDAFSNEISITRPSTTSVIIQAPHGQQTELTLDADGLLIQVESPGGKVYQMSYVDENGLLETFEDPNSKVSTFVYDSDGFLLSDEDTAGFFWNIIHSLNPSNGVRSISMTSAEGIATNYTTTPLSNGGNKRVETRPSAVTRDYSNTPGVSFLKKDPDGMYYNQFFTSDPRLGTATSRVTSSVQYTPDAMQFISRSYFYDVDFDDDDRLNILAEENNTTEAGNTWSSEYNGLTKTYTRTSPEGRVTETQINDQGLVVSVKVASFQPTEYTYDSLGRVTLVSQGTRDTSYTYGLDGFVSEVVDPLNQTWTYGYSADGELTIATLPDTREIKYTYDAGGRRTSITTANNESHGFLYNLWNMIVEYIAPLIGVTNYVTEYEYNLDKKLTKITRPDSSEIAFSYNSTTGLLSTVTTPDSTYSYTYIGEDISEVVSSATGVTNDFTYNGKLVTLARTAWSPYNGRVEYTHTDLKLTDLTVRGTDGVASSIGFSYDDDNLITAVGNLTYTRSSSTGLISQSSIDNVTEEFTYDSNYGELSQYIAKYSSTELYKEVYTRDSLGRISTRAITLPGPSTTTYEYSYDVSGRLTEVYIDNVLTRTYVYDANNNRTSLVASGTTTATYDSQDRILTYGPYTFTYNANGELATRIDTVSGEVFTYSYDGMGALKQVLHEWDNSGTPVTDTYTYINDALSRRVEILKNSALQNRYIYDEFNRLIAELDSNGDILSHFVYGEKAHTPDYMIKSGVRYKFIHDHVGSIVRVVRTDSNSIVSSITYDEFGRITASSTPFFQPFGFAGGIKDPVTGFVRFGARDYDPLTGRWTSKDPILFNGGDTNLYGYVLADPINGIDPTGLFTVCARIPFTGNHAVCPSPDSFDAPKMGQLPPDAPCLGPFCFFPDDNPPLRPPSTEPWPTEQDYTNPPPNHTVPPLTCN